MNLIVAVDKNWAIGYKNKLLVSIPADMRFFRDETTNKVVIMGKNTLESFPGGQPLKNRTNIVIALEKDYKVKDAIVVNSIEDALKEAEKYRSEHVTKIDYCYEADTYFPNLDQMEDWYLAEETEEQTYYDLAYTFCRYERINRK
jgi:dihydrofolate reductase